VLNSLQLKQFLAGLHTTKVNKSETDENTRDWITSFAPGGTKSVTTVVKVHGTMKAGAVRESGSPVLRITADYLFVYVVEPPGDPAGWMRVVQQASGTVEFGSWAGAAGSFEPWYSIGGSTSGVRCDTHDGYLNAGTGSGRQVRGFQRAAQPP